MKKVSFAFSIVLMASLLLAACGGGGGANGTPGALGTSDVGTIPETGMTATADMGGGLDTTPTMMVTEPAVSTATSAAPMATSTMAGGAGAATGTPAAGAAVDVSNQPDRLSALLGYEVRNQNGDVIGEVNGLLVNRSAAVSKDMSEDSTDKDTKSTPAAGTTSTPAAGSTSAAPATVTTGQGSAQVSYVVVELNEVFNGGVTGTDTTAGTGTLATKTPAAGATAMPATTQTASGLAGDDTGTGTVMAGDEVILPMTAFEPLMVGSTTASDDSEDPALMLTVDEQVLATAPIFDRDTLDFAATTWDTDFQAFWSGQGLSISATGDETMANTETVLIEDGFGPVGATNTNGEKLGEVEDFILNPTTGEFRYAILAAGGFLGLGEKYIPVPMNMVNWVADDDVTADRDVTDIGQVLINVPEDAFENAPSFDAMDGFDTSAADWDTAIESYWQAFDMGTTK